MARKDAFRATVELDLPAKFVSDEVGVEIVGNMRALRKIYLSPYDGETSEIARKLKNRRPDIEVEILD